MILRTTEYVSNGHPDKVSDQISDAILDSILEQDENSRVAVEVMVKDNLVVLGGEINTTANVNFEKVVKDVVKDIGYDNPDHGFYYKNLTILNVIGKQSTEIHSAVDGEELGAGDQGFMVGYATNETESFIPLALDLSHKILIELANLRRENKEITYLRPDSKSQVTIEYDNNNKPLRIDTIVISTQHDDFDRNENSMLDKIKSDIVSILIPRVIKNLQPDIKKLFGKDITYHVNPTGKFVIGGPHGDTGLTGRKIIVDTYGGKGGHGGGAFSGKDPSKVDRSAAYAARHMAKNLVAAGVADEILIQMSYAIGVVEPTSIFIDTYGTSKVNLSDTKIASINATLLRQF